MPLNSNSQDREACFVKLILKNVEFTICRNGGKTARVLIISPRQGEAKSVWQGTRLTKESRKRKNRIPRNFHHRPLSENLRPRRPVILQRRPKYHLNSHSCLLQNTVPRRTTLPLSRRLFRPLWSMMSVRWM